MEENNISNTQLKLINTAGPLFAKDGLKGTRIRAITEKAKVNVAGINYHFGGKEKLYEAVADFVFSKIGYINLGTYWRKLPYAQHTRETVYSVIETCLKDIFLKLFKSNHPLWYFKILQRIIVEHDIAIRDLDQDIFESDSRAVREMLEICHGNIRDWDVEAWLAIWYGQTISLSILIPRKQYTHTDDNRLIEGYIDAVFQNTYLAVTSLLERQNSMLENN